MMLTRNELVIINMCMLKEIGKHRLELLSDSYMMDEDAYNLKEKFVEILEQIDKKVVSMRVEMENEELK